MDTTRANIQDDGDDTKENMDLSNNGTLGNSSNNGMLENISSDNGMLGNSSNNGTLGTSSNSKKRILYSIPKKRTRRKILNIPTKRYKNRQEQYTKDDYEMLLSRYYYFLGISKANRTALYQNVLEEEYARSSIKYANIARNRYRNILNVLGFDVSNVSRFQTNEIEEQ